jgi:hypothetical protein
MIIEYHPEVERRRAPVCVGCFVDGAPLILLTNNC